MDNKIQLAVIVVPQNPGLSQQLYKDIVHHKRGGHIDRRRWYLGSQIKEIVWFAKKYRITDRYLYLLG